MGCDGEHKKTVLRCEKPCRIGLLCELLHTSETANGNGVTNSLKRLLSSFESCGRQPPNPQMSAIESEPNGSEFGRSSYRRRIMTMRTERVLQQIPRAMSLC